jgi:hypothetical protein
MDKEKSRAVAVERNSALLEVSELEIALRHSSLVSEVPNEENKSVRMDSLIDEKQADKDNKTKAKEDKKAEKEKKYYQDMGLKLFKH